jgi:CheY-like chemotaxis protein
MKRETLLLVDNDKDFLDSRADILMKEGYQVFKASAINEAEKLLRENYIRLAIIDVRMKDDKDEKDFTGLDITKNSEFAGVPKIMLSNYPSYDAAKKVLGSILDGILPPVEFIDKRQADAFEILLQTIRKVLSRDAKLWRGVKEALAGTDSVLDQDYNDAQKQTRTNYIISIIIALAGITIIFLGIFLAFNKQADIGFVSTAGSIVTTAIGYLFFRRVDVTYRRMDNYHKERIKGHRFEMLLQMCDEIEPGDKRAHCQEKIILAAADTWLRLSSEDNSDKLSSRSKETEKAG